MFESDDFTTSFKEMTTDPGNCTKGSMVEHTLNSIRVAYSAPTMYIICVGCTHIEIICFEIKVTYVGKYSQIIRQRKKHGF